MTSDADAESDPETSGTLTLIGSAHISETYFEHIEETILDSNPDIVAVELDPQRVASLFSDADPSTRDIFKQFSIRAGLLYLALSYVQEQLANAVGIDPDMNDMRTAVETAAQTESRVALIDRDITTTLERVSDNLTPMTLGRMWLRSRRLDEDELPDTSVNDLVGSLEDAEMFATYRELFEQVVPEVSEAFLHERDRIMAQRLYGLKQAGHDIIAVVGGAHEPGIRTELTRLQSTGASIEQARSSPLITPVE